MKVHQLQFDTRRLPAIVGLALALAGCGSSRVLLGDVATAGGLPDAVELSATPFFPQEDYQCGPAALATVLNDSGVAVTPDELVARIYIPERRGSLQVELLAAARTAGRLAYVLDPELGAILAELDVGRPVLVLQNVGPGFAPVWHYAVVVGYDAAAGTLALRSGRTQRKVVTAARFQRTWKDSEHWAMVVLNPDELPVEPDRARYLEAAVALETAGQPRAAVSAFTAAVVRWPDSAAAQFSLANAQYANGDLQAAGNTYRRALDQHPNEPALLNNLAQVLLSQQRCSDAREMIDRAVTHAAAQPSLQDAIADSRTEIYRRCAGEDAAAR